MKSRLQRRSFLKNIGLSGAALLLGGADFAHAKSGGDGREDHQSQRKENHTMTAHTTLAVSQQCQEDKSWRTEN
jgi:hypothetical protein